MTGRKRKKFKKKERKKEKLIGLLQFPWVDFLRGESFLDLFYPILVTLEILGMPKLQSGGSQEVIMP